MRQRGVLESSFYQNACVCWVMPSPVKQKCGGKIQELIKIVAQYKTTTWRETDNVWMAYTTDQSIKNRIGYGAYLLDGARDLNRLKPLPMRLTVDNSTIYEGEYLYGSISNSSSVVELLTSPIPW